MEGSITKIKVSCRESSDHFCGSCGKDVHKTGGRCYDFSTFRNEKSLTTFGIFCESCAAEFVSNIVNAYSEATKKVPHGTEKGHFFMGDDAYKKVFDKLLKMDIGTSINVNDSVYHISLHMFLIDTARRMSKVEAERDSWRKQALEEDALANSFIKNGKPRNCDRFADYKSMVDAWSKSYDTHRLPLETWMFAEIV